MTKDEAEFEAWWLTKFSAEFLDSDNCGSAWTGWKARREVDAKRITELEAKLAIAIDALDMLSKLGNGDRVGNSIGNDIAVEALTKIKGE